MMRIFRRGEPYALAQSMVGLRLGDRFLQLGCGDGGLFIALAGKVGLTGRACAVDEDPQAAERARQSALSAGVLGEAQVAAYQELPYEDDKFDVVVIRYLVARMRPEIRARCLQETRRVLRDGGRLVLIEAADRGGLLGLLGRQRADPHYLAAGGAEGTLREEGFKAVRVLAERDGLRFVEAVSRDLP